MKIIGLVLIIIGLIGTVYFGIQAIDQSETVSAFGVDVAVTTANWTPVIISGVILVIGIIFTVMKKR